MDLTDNIRMACAFLKMSAVQQEALMGLREDGCAPLLGKSRGQGRILHLRFCHSLPAAWEVWANLIHPSGAFSCKDVLMISSRCSL